MVPHPPENVTSIRLSSPPTKVNYIIVANNGFMTTFSSRKRFDYIMEYAGIMGVPPTNIILTSNNLFNGFDMTASWLFQLFRQPNGGTTDSMAIKEFIEEIGGKLEECVLFCDTTFHVLNHYCDEFNHIYIIEEE